MDCCSHLASQPHLQCLLMIWLPCHGISRSTKSTMILDEFISLKVPKCDQDQTFFQYICPLLIRAPQDALESVTHPHGHMHILAYCIDTHLPPLPTSALFKGFGPHVTGHLSADNGIFSRLLSHSGHAHTHI